MIIKANELIHTKTDMIQTESNNLISSQCELRKQNTSLLVSHDAMLSYLSGDITVAYQEIGEYVQAKMNLLCGVLEGMANNNTSFAIEAEKIDENADNKVAKGVITL